MKISKEVQVGLFMVFTIALLYVGFNFLRGIEFFDDNNKYYAKYSNVGGLTVSNAVTISGYSVGRVSNVQIIQSDSNNVVVEMTIVGDIILGEGATAVLDVGLLGETAIKVEPGDISRPIQAGDTLQSELGISIQEVMENTFTPVANTIQSAIVRVNKILDAVMGSEQQIQKIVDDIESITQNSKMTVYELRKNLSDMVKAYKNTISKVDKGLDEIPPVIQKYGEVADSLKAIDIKPVMASAEKTLNDLDELILRINQSEGTLNKVIDDKELYDNLNKTIKHLDEILTHFETRPKDFLAPLGRDKPKGSKKK